MPMLRHLIQSQVDNRDTLLCRVTYWNSPQRSIISFRYFAFEKKMKKYDDFLELSVKQLVIQSTLISLGQTMRCMLKTKC